jgi:hypothetical protein
MLPWQLCKWMPAGWLASAPTWTPPCAKCATVGKHTMQPLKPHPFSLVRSQTLCMVTSWLQDQQPPPSPSQGCCSGSECPAGHPITPKNRQHTMLIAVTKHTKQPRNASGTLGHSPPGCWAHPALQGTAAETTAALATNSWLQVTTAAAVLPAARPASGIYAWSWEALGGLPLRVDFGVTGSAAGDLDALLLVLGVLLGFGVSASAAAASFGPCRSDRDTNSSRRSPAQKAKLWRTLYATRRDTYSWYQAT